MWFYFLLFYFRLALPTLPTGILGRRFSAAEPTHWPNPRWTVVVGWSSCVRTAWWSSTSLPPTPRPPSRPLLLRLPSVRRLFWERLLPSESSHMCDGQVSLSILWCDWCSAVIVMCVEGIGFSLVVAYHWCVHRHVSGLLLGVMSATLMQRGSVSRRRVALYHRSIGPFTPLTFWTLVAVLLSPMASECVIFMSCTHIIHFPLQQSYPSCHCVLYVCTAFHFLWENSFDWLNFPSHTEPA